MISVQVSNFSDPIKKMLFKRYGISSGVNVNLSCCEIFDVNYGRITQFRPNNVTQFRLDNDCLERNCSLIEHLRVRGFYRVPKDTFLVHKYFEYFDIQIISIYFNPENASHFFLDAPEGSKEVFRDWVIEHGIDVGNLFGDSI